MPCSLGMLAMLPSHSASSTAARIPAPPYPLAPSALRKQSDRRIPRAHIDIGDAERGAFPLRRRFQAPFGTLAGADADAGRRLLAAEHMHVCMHLR